MVQSEIKNQLSSMAEPEFLEFTRKLLPGVSNIMGVRLRLLRKLAKRIVKEDWKAYLENPSEDTFEEIMLQGFVIGCLKEDVDLVLHYIARFVPKITNWSVCDSFCSSLKIVKSHRELFFTWLKPYINSEKEYEARFGAVLLLNYFVDNNYVEAVLQELDSIRQEDYYARMAVAWGVSICYIRFPDITLNYLKHNSLDDFTYNKALQKIVESLTIDNERKDMIRSMKRR